MALIPIVENKKKSLGIYVHIPFCRSKCEYCDFYSIPGARSRDLMDRYLDAVILHIREAAQGAAGYEVDTVYFGGGTPSFFGAGGLAKIFAEIDRRFDVSRDAEVSLEANPDSVTLPMLTRLRRAGFNRISIGVQSDDDAQLKALGRPHNYRQAQQAVSLARRAGFDNVSVDLMFGLPNQSREQWMQTLRHVIDLKADHISCYGLKVEPGTKLYEYRNCANLPDDDAQLTNIEEASQSISGYMLEYGDAFSFNDIVGPRTTDAGYVRAINGRGVKVTGGGVAQVASTVYLAVKQVDSITVDYVRTYGDRFTGGYVDDADDAIVTDYNAGIDFSFTYYGSGTLIVYVYEEDGLLICDLCEIYD